MKEIIDPETGAINYDTIWTKVDQQIAENTAIATLSANHAFADGNKSLIEYLSSGIDAVAGDLTTFADFYSTYMSPLADVTSLINSKVDKTTYEASLKAVADTTMYKVQRDSNGKPVLDQNGDYIYLDANGNVTDKAHRIIDTQNTAGLVLDTDLDSAIAALVATNNSGTTAAIKTLVEGDSSLISLIADQVTVPTGELIVGENAGRQIKASVYPVYQRHQSSSEPADMIPQIRLTYDNQKAICIGAIDQDQYSYSDDGWDFKNVIGNDGSGKLANGNITWDTTGNVRFTDSIISRKITSSVDPNLTLTIDDAGIQIHGVTQSGFPMYVQITEGAIDITNPSTHANTHITPGSITLFDGTNTKTITANS